MRVKAIEDIEYDDILIPEGTVGEVIEIEDDKYFPYVTDFGVDDTLFYTGDWRVLPLAEDETNQER